MRLKQLYLTKRTEILWCAIGFIVCQVVVGLGVEHLWPGVRDPEYAIKEDLLKQRIAEKPDRPIIVGLGSSRMRMGLEAERMSQLHGSTGPLVFNFGILAAGPMMEKITLERMLAAGIRPNLVLLEVMPLHLDNRRGGPIEENSLNGSRLTFVETIRLSPYIHSLPRVGGLWFLGRVVPANRHQSELHALMKIDVPMPGQPGSDYARGMFPNGWQPHCIDMTEEERRAKTNFAVGQYVGAAIGFQIDPKVIAAFHDTLELCRREKIDAALVMMPEGTAFRRLYSTDVARQIDTSLGQLTTEFDVPIIDARTWVADEGFWDSHHMLPEGARVFSDRLDRDVLGSLLRHRPAASAPAKEMGAQVSSAPSHAIAPLSRP